MHFIKDCSKDASGVCFKTYLFERCFICCCNIHKCILVFSEEKYYELSYEVFRGVCNAVFSFNLLSGIQSKNMNAGRHELSSG